ncbi:holo-ACP synthase [Aquifex aeolicus]|uniref:Holo-[acyl-carrier-protein] synthase n=1 Tax=Aquifex aeolicus (strain VF5) TaxID=224324 RepID=ACPS_AQUAE|nr:holo-ACP synthase [Aquifex aeolicus]O66995.1 RecName: Full=Holo-[acyl-carrier-protein] synthase; Short=Holo-ACP synthase; AltName: Full=4'-phosphopantetheinyl transferase AcpS [Aquifex aeolicus VF5]AAC06947.1 holo-[acyl-carrier protein] synthase [Aquifex aeolicus VF5]
MIGVDIVKNERIKDALERFGDKFLDRIYTKRELEYCYAHCDFLPCLAARWAGKEAVLKAFYTEFKIFLRFKEIEILGNRGRPPTVVINREGVEEILKNYEVIVSLSHERDYSVAVAYIKKKS